MPNAKLAVIQPRKLTHYLLAQEHDSGGPKARFLIAAGFSKSAPQQLEAALLDHAMLETAVQQQRPGARSWRITGPINAPNGRSYEFTTIWQVLPESDIPSLVTAFPGKRP